MRKSLFEIAFPSVSPSLLAADQSRLLEEVHRCEKAGAKIIHFDVMDGSFVPNLSFFGDELVDVLPNTNAYRDVHLMVDDAMGQARRYFEMGADSITVHLEALEKQGITPKEFREAFIGREIGISIKPKTPIESIIPYIEYVDLMLLMSVEPGKGGQSFIEGSEDRARFIKEKIKASGRKVALSIDGGINGETSKKARASGVDILVAGSYFFKAPTMEFAMGELLNG